MKLKLLTWFKANETQTLANFDHARCVKKLTGTIESIGGSAVDCTATREWVFLLLPEATI